MSSSAYNQRQREALENTDASWDTLPLTRSAGGEHVTASGGSSSSGIAIFPKRLFHGLAAMLVVSLCLLLVELKTPGIVNRYARSFYTRSNAASMAISNNGGSANSHYSPVPAPFLAHKQARFVEIAPTSEPTIMNSAEFDALAPTSEPTEYKDRMGSFMVHDGPTSEPTEYRASGETMKLADVDGSPTHEPTIFDADNIPAVGEPTNEPTLFHSGKIPEVDDHGGDDIESRPTCESSGDCAGGFCNFDEGSHGYCELCSNFDSPEQCHEDGLPDKGADECRDVCFEDDGSRRAVPTAEPTMFHFTSEPTVFGQTNEPTVEGQTSEPTVYGQSGEPTVYGQSGEPTVFGQSGEPTVFSGVGTNEPTIFGHDSLDGHEPTNEPTVFFEQREPEPVHHPKTHEPTPSPSIPPHLHTWSPTGGGSFAPTSDPTIFPTPEPTAAI